MVYDLYFTGSLYFSECGSLRRKMRLPRKVNLRSSAVAAHWRFTGRNWLGIAGACLFLGAFCPPPSRGPPPQPHATAPPAPIAATPDARPLQIDSGAAGLYQLLLKLHTRA